MTKQLAPLLAVALAISGSAAFAGGPVVIEEEGQPEVIEQAPRSGWILPVIVGVIVICAIACGDDEDTPPADDDDDDDDDDQVLF